MTHTTETTPNAEKIAAREVEELAEAARWRPDDEIACVWPSDIPHNISAAARVAAKKGAQVFRKALERREA